MIDVAELAMVEDESVDRDGAAVWTLQSARYHESPDAYSVPRIDIFRLNESANASAVRVMRTDWWRAWGWDHTQPGGGKDVFRIAIGGKDNPDRIHINLYVKK